MLSALATSAVPGFQAVSTQTLSSAEKDVALVHDVNQVPWLVELPTSASAEVAHAETLRAVRALSEGLRSRLSFRVPRLAGTTEVGQHTLSVCEYLPGQAPSAHKVTPILAASIGTALAQIHSLPTSSVQDFDRPAESAIDSLRECAGIVDRAAPTGLIPQALLRRWETACEDSSLWQFEPTVIHGLMQLGHLLVENENVVAVDQWRDFRVGDPARDLAWLTTPAASEFHMAVVTSYRSARTSADRWVMQRARFYAELDVAKWLLHGMDSHNETITEDATAMLSALHDRVSGDMDQALTQPISQAKHPLEN
jgi:aminoglycoside phosphotransferase (APT) family kinase protein